MNGQGTHYTVDNRTLYKLSRVNRVKITYLNALHSDLYTHFPFPRTGPFDRDQANLRVKKASLASPAVAGKVKEPSGWTILGSKWSVLSAPLFSRIQGNSGEVKECHSFHNLCIELIKNLFGTEHIVSTGELCASI